VVDFIKMGMGAEQWVAAAFGIARNPDIRRQFDELEEKAWAERQTEEDEFNANFEIIRDLMNARQEAVIALIGEEAFDDLSDDRVRELVHKPAEEELAAMKAGLKVKEDDFDWEMTARRRLMGEYIDEAIAKMGEETFYNLPEDRRRALVHDRADRVIDVMKRVRERKAAEDQTQKQESYIEIDPDMPMKDFAAFCLANVNRVSPEDADKFRDALESGDQDVEAAIEGAPNRCKALIKLVGLSESCHEQFDDDFFKVWSPSEDDLREFVTNPNMRSDLQIMVAGSLAFDKLGVVKKRFDAIMKEEVVKVAN